MLEELQPQDVVETDEEKTERYNKIKPIYIEGLASLEGKFNQAEFSRQMNVPEATLSNWKKQQWFKDAYVKAIENNMVLFIKDLYVKAKEKALDGDFNFFRALLGQLEVLKTEKKEAHIKIEFPQPILGGKSVSTDESIISDTQAQQTD